MSGPSEFPAEKAMSLVLPESSHWEMASWYTVQEFGDKSYTIVAVVITILCIRGAAQLSFDVMKVLTSLFSKKFKEVGVQTDEGSFKFPETVYLTKSTNLVHFSTCHHVSASSERKQLCKLCWKYEF